VADKYLIVDHLTAKDLSRIFSKIVIHPDLQYNETSCWIWSAYRTDDGYGEVHWRARTERAHRIIFTWATKIPLPMGWPIDWETWVEVDHLCKRPSCCNPVHLEVVSRHENLIRGNGLGAQYSRTELCVNGHLKKTITRSNDTSYRRCTTCRNERELRRKKRIRHPSP